MYSREKRLKAVLLYIKLGYAATATIRILGYPETRKTVKVWYDAYAREGENVFGYRRRAKYTEEKVERAIAHFLEHGRRYRFTMRELGYPGHDLLQHWVRERVPDVRMTSGQRDAVRSSSDEEKRQAVVDLCSRTGSAQEVAERVGVSRVQLYTWRRELLQEAGPTVKRKRTKAGDEATKEALKQEVEDLERRIHKLKLEHDIMVKATEIARKDPGINPRDLTNREKTLLIDAMTDTYRVTEIREALGLPRSSYFYHRSRLRLPERYLELRRQLRAAFEENRSVYGYRRLHIVLRRDGAVVSEKVVRRVMREEHLSIVRQRRRRFTAYAGESMPAADNLLQRDFRAELPNQKWLTDITEFGLPAAKVYLSPIIDCFDGMVVSWSIGTRPDANLVNTMLDHGIEQLPNGAVPIVHSDRGAHYRWPGWIHRTTNAGITRSMSKKGCTPDNAACEGFFGRLKTEMFYNRNWRNTTVKQFIKLVDEYIRWYNEKRIKLSLGGLSPVEYRASRGLVA
jgi:putative transposase